MSLGKKMFHGMAWSAIERISVQALQFGLGIILARILTPEEYGTLAILLVFIAISNVFIDSGFTKALIQKQDRTEIDISTIFWFNIAISLICYAILWFAAPFIADFYDIEILSDLLRVLALSIVLNALFSVPMTLYTIKLDFKTPTKINIIATILSGCLAIYMAFSGLGIWALVAQTISRTLTTACLIWVYNKWRPILGVSKDALRSMFSFGSNLLVSSLLNVSVNNMYSLFIAKLISTQDLGFYDRGSQFSNFFRSIIAQVLGNVLLPGLSTVQDQREILVAHTRKIIKATALLVIPLFMFLSIIAEPLIRVLLTEKWIMAVPIMQIFCIARMITIISGINVNLLYVIGRTDLTLRQLYVKIVVRVVFFFIALKYGIIFIAIAELASTAVHFFINTYYPGKMMNYGGWSQLKDLKLIILSGLIMVLVVYLATFKIENDILKLCIAPIVAAVSYFALVRTLKIPELEMIKDRFKEFVN